MDPTAVRDLLATETDRVEWKTSLEDSEGIRKAVCALANDLGAAGAPGFVLVGVEKDGRVVGVDTSRHSLDEAQQVLSNRLHDIMLQPTPSVSMTTDESTPGRFLVIIEVAPYPVPPVVTLKGVAWVRVGTTTRRAFKGWGVASGGRAPCSPGMGIPTWSRPRTGTRRLWCDGDPHEELGAIQQ